MRTHRIILALLSSLGVLVATGARAQQTSEEPPKVEEIRAVERGAFLEGEAGLGWLVNKVENRSYGMSLMTGAFVGYDVLPILSVQAGAYAFSASVRIPSTPDDKPYGDLFFVIPMAQVQFAL